MCWAVCSLARSATTHGLEGLGAGDVLPRLLAGLRLDRGVGHPLVRGEPRGADAQGGEEPVRRDWLVIVALVVCALGLSLGITALMVWGR